MANNKLKAKGPAQAAAASFPNRPPKTSASCPVNNPPGKPSTAKTWTIDDLKNNLTKCDGGTDVWAKAKAANGDKDPVVKTGPTGTGGFVDTKKGEITIDTNQDKCFAKQVLIQELSNLSHKTDFTNASKSCHGGDLSREDYIKAYERAEYDGVQNVITAFDACKDKWGCTTCEKEWARKYKTFDDYYDKALSKDHKENYGKFWDAKCKAAYDTKHPAPPPPKPAPP